MSKFNQGDIVKLMSGGPLMTVIFTAESPAVGFSAGYNDPVRVAWVDGEQKLQTALLDSSALKREMGI